MPRSSPSSPRIAELIETVRKSEAIKDGFAFASGRLDAINWGEVNQAFRDHADWIRQMQRARDRMAAPDLDGVRQLAVRVPGRPGRESCSPRAIS